MEQARAIARASVDPAAPAVRGIGRDDLRSADGHRCGIHDRGRSNRRPGRARCRCPNLRPRRVDGGHDDSRRCGVARDVRRRVASDPDSYPNGSWVAHERFLREVAKLPALDPVTSELVRLRGARAHDCQLCQSRRNVTAIDLTAGRHLFDDRDPGGISDAQALALQVVDTFVWQPISWSPGLGQQVVDAFGPAPAAELTLDIRPQRREQDRCRFRRGRPAGGGRGRV